MRKMSVVGLMVASCFMQAADDAKNKKVCDGKTTYAARVLNVKKAQNRYKRGWDALADLNEAAQYESKFSLNNIPVPQLDYSVSSYRLPDGETEVVFEKSFGARQVLCIKNRGIVVYRNTDKIEDLRALGTVSKLYYDKPSSFNDNASVSDRKNALAQGSMSLVPPLNNLLPTIAQASVLEQKSEFAGVFTSDSSSLVLPLGETLVSTAHALSSSSVPSSDDLQAPASLSGAQSLGDSSVMHRVLNVNAGAPDDLQSDSASSSPVMLHNEVPSSTDNASSSSSSSSSSIPSSGEQFAPVSASTSSQQASGLFSWWWRSGSK